MSELVRKVGTLVRRPPRDLQPSLHQAATTERVAFVGRHLTWADLPAQTRRAARRPSVLVTEDVQRDPRVWMDGGRAYELASGWRVYEDAVLIALVRRPLLPAVAGFHRPAGPWTHLQVQTEELRGPLRRRRGLVAVADELTEQPPALLGAVRDEDSSAAEAWTYLPSTVRDDAERLVPEPEIWFGQIVQGSTAQGLPLSQSVQILRMSATRAVVVMADRALPPRVAGDVDRRRSQLARTPWLVEQVGSDLGTPAARLERG